MTIAAHTSNHHNWRVLVNSMWRKTAGWAAPVIAIALSCPGVAGAATSVLYRNDYNVGTDIMDEALTATGDAVTQTSGNLGAFTLSNYNIVVYANQDLSIPFGDLAALNTYIAGGGKVIFDDWTQSDGFNGGELFTGNNNLNVITLTSLFSSGIGAPLDVVNPGWGIFSTGMTALAGAVSAGTFENGDSAIVVGNSGRTIVNGFLTDTVDSETLYLNELDSLSATTAVPEPGTLALLGLGLAVMGFSRRKFAR